jgi:hypothetical protein
MKVRFTSVGDEFSQPLFFFSQSLHPRVVFLIFSVCVSKKKNEKTASTEMAFVQKLKDIFPTFDQRFKDESLIILISINMFHKV